MQNQVGIPRTKFAATALIALWSVAHLALAQTPAPAVPAAAPATSPQPDYHPSMGDLMTMAVQPRHIKLGLAGRQKNWPYAAYELNELRNAFARIARTIPKYQTMDTAEMSTALTKAPLDALDQAIAAANVKQFSAAYTQLTQACNGCHQSEKHGFVVVKTPDAAMFPDQDFAPAPR